MKANKNDVSECDIVGVGRIKQFKEKLLRRVSFSYNDERCFPSFKKKKLLSSPTFPFRYFYPRCGINRVHVKIFDRHHENRCSARLRVHPWISSRTSPFG